METTGEVAEEPPAYRGSRAARTAGRQMAMPTIE